MRHIYAVALGVALFATPAFAQTEEASAHFKRGVQFFQEQDFRGALIEFKRAYEIQPKYLVLYNIGQTSLELQDYAAALTALKRYLDEGGKAVPRDRRVQVESEIKKLEGRVARVTVKANVDGADVLVDDVVVGKTPLTSPLVVSAGRRKIGINKAGSPPQSRAIDVAGGDETSVDLEIAQQQTVVVAPTPENPNPQPIIVTTNPPPQPAPSGGGPSAATWIGVAVTGAAGVATIVMGSLAIGAKGQYDEAIGTPNNAVKISDARDKTKTFAVATDVLLGATIVSAGITLVLALTTRAGPKTAEHVKIDFGPTGASIRGAF